MRTATVTLVIVTALAVALTACGGGPPDPDKVYAEAGEKMAALASYHVMLDFQDEGNGDSGTIEFDVVPPDRFQTEFRSNRGWRMTFVGIGDNFYVKTSNSPDWFFYSDRALGQPVPNGAAFAAGLLTQVTDLTYVAEETLAGVSTYHLQGSLAPEVLAFIVPEDPPAESIALDLWVGTEDSLVRRYEMAESGNTATLTLSTFGEAVQIVAPVNPRPAEELDIRGSARQRLETPDQMKEVIAGLTAEERECLRSVLGESAFGELEAGTRLPTREEFQLDDECFGR